MRTSFFLVLLPTLRVGRVPTHTLQVLFTLLLAAMQEYISKALLSTQIVRLQQCLTDIEFLRAKHYLILRDLGVIGKQSRKYFLGLLKTMQARRRS